MTSRSGQLASDLIGRVREEVSAAASRNRFVDLLEAGGVPRDRLTWLAGEQFRIVGSDQRSFALLAARFPDPPAGEMFLALAQGELRALRLLADFRTRSRSGTRSPPAFAMDREDHERTIAADVGGSSASGLCICDRP